MLLVLATAIAVPGHSPVRVALVLDLSLIAFHFGACLDCFGVHALPSCSAGVLRLVHEWWRRLVHLVDCVMDVGIRDVDHVMN